MPEAQGWGRRLLRQRELPRQAGETASPPVGDSQGAHRPRRGRERREEDSGAEEGQERGREWTQRQLCRDTATFQGCQAVLT